jgi:hypothetical protein
MIRAKFNVISVVDQGTAPNPKNAEIVTLLPVYSPDPESENHAFWTATPQGRVEMTINNQDAWGKFKQGSQYFVDFTPVNEEQQQ